MDTLVLLLKTIALRPYVFVFLVAYLASSRWLLGWRRTTRFFLITWTTAFICELSSTRTGIPFGLYHYTMSSIGEELYLGSIPFIDPLSFTFLLYGSYCMALCLLLPADNTHPVRPGLNLLPLRFDTPHRRSPAVLILATFLFVLVDMAIDPVSVRGDRWFLGSLYYYPEPGTHFGVPLANYVGWAVVGLTSLMAYSLLDRQGPPLASAGEERTATRTILVGCGVYYGAVAFILAVAFSIGEYVIGLAGLLMYGPVTAFLVLRLTGRLPAFAPRPVPCTAERRPRDGGQPSRGEACD
jgi:uncharacterized membrane protein